MDKRLIYRVVLKLLFLLLLVVLTLVFLNSLFIQSNDENYKKTSLSVVELDIGGMVKGDIRKTQWKGKQVNVLRLDNRYFTYVNIGDSGNCPLFKEANGLKDICTGTRFNFYGYQKGNEKQGFMLLIPPNYYKNGTLYIGVTSK